MKIESLQPGMQVKHPQYGLGVVKSIDEHTAAIKFGEVVRTIAPETSGLEPAEALATFQGLEMPLVQLIQLTARVLVREMGWEKDDAIIEQLGIKWHKGRMVLHPADPTLQTKEVPLDVFFHKIVMVRNNLRVLEQKINAQPQLTDGEKVEMQQYITRSYGSLTTFNLLFKSKEDQFNTAAE